MRIIAAAAANTRPGGIPLNHAALIVVTARVSSPQEAEQAVRRALRLSSLASSGGAVLLLCALDDAPARVMPQDAPILRLLQSGIQSAAARGTGRLELLALSREWDDAARAFVSPLCPARLAARLLLGLEPGVSFAAATVSPASLRGAFERILITDSDLAPVPGALTPLAHAARLSPDGLARAGVLPCPGWPEPLLSRLERAGFALSPVRETVSHALAREGMALTAGGPLLLERRAFAAASDSALPERCVLCDHAFFVRRQSLVTDALLARERRAQALAFTGIKSLRDVLSPQALSALVSPLRLLGLLLSAAWGIPLLALAAIVMPEGYALAHPRLLPGALVRLSLIPADALGALDALARRLLARSRFFRIELPDSAFGARACTLWGAALLALAVVSARALVPLSFVSLLWLCAPLVYPALSSPPRERIPLSPEEREELLSLARTAFLRLPAHSRDDAPPFSMLAACAGCMLGLLEPDEAARRVQALLPLPNDAPLSAAQQAALLVSAQYLRERMSGCDAALRPLPALLDNSVRACPPPDDRSPLSTLLCAARGQAAPNAALIDPGSSSPADALFLPAALIPCPPDSALEPLFRPHTYLARQEEGNKQGGEADSALRFLALASAALDAPFVPLLSRSPLAEPALPLLAMIGRAPVERLSSR